MLTGVAIFTTIAGLGVVTACADVLVLTNGDQYRGAIISMDAKNVVFQSEIQGRVILPRSKISAVTLHGQVASPDVVTKKTATPVVAPAIPANTNAAANIPVTSGKQADAVVQELRKQGIDPKLIDQVQEQIFGKSSPEAAQKFNDLMGGLLTGQLSVGDIRKQAQKSIADINSAKKDLGGDAGEMLDSYLGILEKFVQDSSTDTTITTPAKPAPTK